MGDKGNNSMTLVGHLQELRKRIIWVLIVLFISLIVGFIYAESLIEYFKNSPAAADIEWNVFRLQDAILIYMKFAFLIGLTITLPFALYQVWRFVAPGLTKKEKRATIWFIPSAFFLFLIGISFAYFITFPMIVKFLNEISVQLGTQQVYGLYEYFNLMFTLVVPFGLLFELPVIVVFLTRLGILTPKLLIKFRKIAYLILVIIAAAITPPDFISQILVAIPLILLYEFSIWLSKIASNNRDKISDENDPEFEAEKKDINK